MAIDPQDTGDLQMDVARRLAAVRRVLDLDQEEFADRAGLSQPRYNQYETGKRLLTLPAAMMLCEHYLLTLDWIYRGDPSGLPYRIADKLNEARKGKR